MAALLHPGVYVREVPSSVRSIEGAPTSTTIFVGATQRGPLGATKIKSRTEYERLFGGYTRDRDDAGSPPEPVTPTRVLTTYAIDGFFRNGGSTAYIVRAMDAWNAAETASRSVTHDDDASPPASQTEADAILASSPGIWGNQLAVAYLDSTDGDPNRFRLAVVYRSPDDGERRLVENWDRLSPDPNDESYVVDVLARSLYIRWNPEVDAVRPSSDTHVARPEESDIIDTHAQALTGGVGGGGTLDAGDYSAILEQTLQGIDDAALLVAACDEYINDATADEYVGFVDAFRGYADTRPRQDLFFVGDLPPRNDVATVTEAVSRTVGSLTGALGGPTVSTSDFMGLYWPHVEVSDPVGIGRNPTIVLPPAGYVAGLFARIDARRGVWKAPAGTEATLNGVLALGHALHDGHSDELNPRGINALRQLPGAGRVVWGARTTVPNGPWRYVPVRRTAMFLRASIFNSIHWAVFEPNDEPLWASLRATIGGFMETQFRNGAFAGATSDVAYFVKVDSETTSVDDQAAGVVNILVGFSPLRPAEFVVVKLSQVTQSPA